ncbi:putative disease resistance protein RGA1 [Chenopodium quinoa]|uniref:NB-ARC domain-containing protein n=1 Tax=Chenopodium quinoa TaxID=63459 RepID=A0A803LSD6_CHEQI|nr:putative disease resistance protein RGA1 [Chenopodium quinoa]
MEEAMKLRHDVWEIRKKLKNDEKTLSRESGNDMLHSLEIIEGKLEVAESELQVPGAVLEESLKDVLSKLKSFIEGDQNEEDAKSILEKLSRWVTQEDSVLKPLEQAFYGGINVQHLIEMTLNFNLDQRVLAIPIIGTRATAAVQRVYHDNRVRSSFEERHWVCMCDMNHGHPSKLLDLVFRKQTSNIDILKDFHSNVDGKRYLLILDGVTQTGLGFFLEDLLRDVSHGSRVILTASSKDKLGMLEPLKMPEGAPIESTSMLQEEKEISSKYAGASGLLKTIAFFLSFKHTVQKWENFADDLITKLQDLSESSYSKFNLISYEDLQLKIQQCVRYVSLLQKDYEFSKTDLIHLWASQDYLSTDTGRPEELVGEEYFEKLLNNGFFSQVTSRDGAVVQHFCKTHYVLNEFLKNVAKTQFCLGEEPTREVDDANILHVSFAIESSWEAPSWLLNAGKLQSLIFLPSRLHNSVNVPNLEEIISKLTGLQALDLVAVNCENLSHSLGELKHLRYLRLGVSSKCLPESVINLSLVWSSSYSKPANLEKFDYLQPPHGLRSLAVCHWKGENFPLQLMFGKAVFDSLVSIYIEDCRGCKDLPSLSSLPHLRFIKLWDLNVLEYVEHDVDSGNNTGSDSSTLRHYFPSLEYLLLANLPRLERWSRKQQYPIPSRNLTLCVSNCPKMSSMPLLRSLVSLEAHDIHVKLLKHLLSTSAGPSPGATLRKLEIVSVSQLKSTFPIRNLNALESLAIRRCPELEELVLGSLTSLQRLEIHECNGLVDITVGNMDQLSALETLEIKHCKKLKLLNSSEDWKCFKSLRFLKLISIFNLESLKNGLCSLHKLEGLYLYSLYELRSLPEWIGDIKQLRSLAVRNCPFLITLPESLGSLSTLQQLDIHCCPKLKEIPKSFADLKSLQKLVIQRCPKLSKRCQKSHGPDFPLIQHVPYREY